MLKAKYSYRSWFSNFHYTFIELKISPQVFPISYKLPVLLGENFHYIDVFLLKPSSPQLLPFSLMVQHFSLNNLVVAIFYNIFFSAEVPVQLLEIYTGWHYIYFNYWKNTPDGLIFISKKSNINQELSIYWLPMLTGASRVDTRKD